MDEDNADQMRKLIQMTLDTAPPKRFSFSREINLGHVVVALTFILGGFATYLSFHDSNIEHSNRVRLLEISQDRSDKTLAQIAQNQISTEKAVTQLTYIVDELRKDKSK